METFTFHISENDKIPLLKNEISNYEFYKKVSIRNPLKNIRYQEIHEKMFIKTLINKFSNL